LGNPKLIIVDEPTAGLDPEERVRFHNLLSQIGENIVVILSTHIVDDVSDLCSQMAVIDRGQTLLVGEPRHAIAALVGKIWTKSIHQSELAAHLQRFQVISTRLFAGRTVIRVYGLEQPDSTFEGAPPDLQDVYFWTLKRRTWERQPARATLEPS